MSEKLKIAYIKSFVEDDAGRVTTLGSLRIILLTTKNHAVLRCAESSMIAIRLDHWPNTWGPINKKWVLRGERPKGGPYHYDRLFGVKGVLPHMDEYPVTMGECEGLYNKEGTLFITVEYVLVPEEFVLERIKSS